MNGMEMMIKSMGIQTEQIKLLLDPENIKQLLTKIETMCNQVDDIHNRTESMIIHQQNTTDRLNRIEIKLQTIPTDEALEILDANKDVLADVTREMEQSYGINGNTSSNN